MRLQCFHACKRDGGKEAVQTRAPFLSEDSNRTWLSQGYYFWFEDQKQAEWWGRTAIQKNGSNYAIVEVILDFSDDPESLLDLVGSPSSLQDFQGYLRKYREHLKRVAPKKVDSITISSCIKHFRTLVKKHGWDVFPVAAIKAADAKPLEPQPIKFTASTKEAIALYPRQQICLFAGSEGYIVSSEIRKPEEWCG